MKKTDSFIVIEELHKKYGKNSVLHGVSLTVDRGSFLGVFGKNGAGKTTLFKTILGLVSPTSGSIYIDGRPIKNVGGISIGYLPENIALYGHLSVADNLRVAALSAGNDLSRPQIEAILDRVNLSVRRTPSRDLSLGMKRRLQFAMAALTKPVDLLILDEPTNGMDVNGVLWLKEYLGGLKTEGRTILVCSHSLNIMEDVIDDYCVLKGGQIVRREKWKKERACRYRISLQILSGREEAVLSSLGDVLKIDGHTAVLTSGRGIYQIVKSLIDHEVKVGDVKPITDSLEKIFIESVSDNAESSESGVAQN